MSDMHQLVCWLLGHDPALVTQPCRCLRCGAMIEWDDKGGWRYAGLGGNPRWTRNLTSGESKALVELHGAATATVESSYIAGDAQKPGYPDALRSLRAALLDPALASAIYPEAIIDA